MTAEQALDRYPDLSVAISDRPIRGRRGMLAPVADRLPFLRQGFRSTIVEEDTRLPTMEIGLGDWTYSLDAFFTEEETVSIEGSRVRVGEHWVLEGGMLRDASGRRLEIDRPLQLFSRWYGFALTFPGTTIYGR